MAAQATTSTITQAVALASGVAPASSIPASLLHLHWTALIGCTSFIASVLNLIPMDNTSGSKMASATFGERDLMDGLMDRVFIIIIINH